MLLNEEFLRIYEELSDINNDLEEKFDAPGAEVVYGEEATTVEGVLRYFVEDIPTLAAIISRGRIKASQQKETDTNSPLGDKNYKRRSFVSFSRQLFSHAYRAPKKWKYGIAVDQKALETKAQQMSNTDICPDFDHPGNNMMVFGAAKLEDGTELLVTSFGSFIMNLNEQTRKLLKQHQGISIEKTDFYNSIKNFFDAYIDENSVKKQDKLISYTEDIAEVEKLVVKRRQLDSAIVEGFVLRSFCRTHSLAPRFTELCNTVPGLFEYLKEHTNLNEGEFRIWVAEGQEYLDISDCITGIVLPSNYKENNYDNEQNTAPDVLYLRKLVAEQDLTIYVYQSKEESNIPDIDLSKKQAKVLKRLSIMEYFHKITRSREAVIDFINNELPKHSLATGGYCLAYNKAISKNTTTAYADVNQNNLYNYKAFLNAISEYEFNLKDVAAIYKTGQPLPNAQETFNEKTKDVGTVQTFLKQLSQDYPKLRKEVAYITWFSEHTNATRPDSSVLEPASVQWSSFVEYCKQHFNYTVRDLEELSKGQQLEASREPIKNLFKKAAGTNRKTTLKYIKLFATIAAKHTIPSLSSAYSGYMGRAASDVSGASLQKELKYNYMAWLTKVTDPEGPIKLTKEEVQNYFKNFIAEANNQ